jgi:hypothetical protein
MAGLTIDSDLLSIGELIFEHLKVCHEITPQGTER